MIIVQHFVVGLYACNCYILSCEKTSEAMIIDPGDSYEKLLDYIQKNHLQLKYILLTHAHLDHVMAVNRLRDFTSAKTVMHKADLYLSQNIALQSSVLQLPCEDKRGLQIDDFATSSTELNFGRHTLACLHTPGHSPGSCCYHLPDAPLHSNVSQSKNQRNSIVYSGDTLFAGSIGRTDLWEGDHEQIIDSIQTQLLPLQKETLIFPGHGDSTTIEREIVSNPFL